MRKFEIKPIEIKTQNETTLSQYKFGYNVKSDGFEADVVVFDIRKGFPFVHKHLCSKGGEVLWRFNFWNELQTQVLKYHINLMEEKENESRI